MEIRDIGFLIQKKLARNVVEIGNEGARATPFEEGGDWRRDTEE